MFRRIISATLWLSLMAVTAQAGEVKTHDWPNGYTGPVDARDIPVVMDVGFWIHIKDPGSIKLYQRSIHSYRGCVELDVLCNFNLRLECLVTATGAVPGTYACSLDKQNIDAPGTQKDARPRLCVDLDNASIDAKPGGSTDVHVATVTIRATPRASY